MTAKPTLRVVEIASGVAGPACGRLLAGLGHDVVKVEFGAGDYLRSQPPLNLQGTGLFYVALNADKQSVAVESIAEVDGLLDAADVVILDVLPERARELGVAPEQLRQSRPELVVVWITAFGSDGEYRDVEGDSLLAEAYGGLATMIGDSARRPLSLGGEQAAYCGAVTGFLGAMMALRRREQGHGGDVVEVALCDVAAYMDWKGDIVHFMTGAAPVRDNPTAGEWRMVRARDGWVGFIFQQRHWSALVELVGAPELRDPDLVFEASRLARSAEWWPVVQRWAAELDAQEIYNRAQQLGLPFGWVVPASGLASSDQLRGRGFIADVPVDQLGQVPAVTGPVYSTGLAWRSGPAPALGAHSQAEVAWQPRSASNITGSTDGVLPLSGIRVLDFGTITAGAAATRLLADHGATVIKVEWIDRPDTFRSWKMPQGPDGSPPSLDSPYFPSNNVGKLDVAIDLKTVEGRELVHRLAAQCHVVVENFRVGVTERLGIDYASLSKVNPDLIYLSLSSQGQQGPESRNSSFGSTLDLLSGLASLTGYEADQPVWSSNDVNYPDQLVSLMGAAFVAYCVQQKQTGLNLDVSQREVVSWTLATQVADYAVNGADSVVSANRRPGRAPHDTFPAQDPDKWIALSCTNDAERDRLVSVIGRPDLAGHDEQWWHDHEADVYDAVATWTSTRDRFEAATVLREAGVPAAPVMDAADRAKTSRFADHLVTLPSVGAPVKGFPMRFSHYQPPLPTWVPAIGADTTELLREVAGVLPAELERMQQLGVLYSP